MRIIVLLFALALPLVAWFSSQGAFGPDNGTVSGRYPTLLVAAGYAFAIWGLIFLLDLVYAVWQATGVRRRDSTLSQIAPWAAAGFALTALWMPLFSMGWFWACLVVILLAFVCLARCALILSRDDQPLPRQWLMAWTPLSLHAGWLSVAAFLNIAQVVVAYRLLSTTDMLGWSLALFAVAAIVLLGLNQRMRGNIGYVAAAVWGLIAIHMQQSSWDLRGASIAGGVALGIALVLVVHTVWLRMRERDGLVPGAANP